MLYDEALPFWAVSLGVVVPIVAVLAVCICGCKKTVPKNELLGLAGMVKLTNPDECLNSNLQVADEGRSGSADTSDVNRRTSTTANRSLPDIPIDSERQRLTVADPLWEGEPNGDTSSELYATVEENKNALQPLVATRPLLQGSKRLSARSSHPIENKSSENSHADDGCNPYARLKAEHPYDRLKKSEHPYAQVGATADAETSDMAAQRSDGDPVPPPRMRKSSQRSSLPDNIPAATAIAGQVAASQELPYMTPPVPVIEAGPSSTDFSGDSHDSKGYTSISVREPLAAIRAQTKANRTRQLLDSHYATVSDDSDEMYAAIEEPGQVYTSGSEMYAQIRSAMVPETDANESLEDGVPFPPQPPSVDSLKHVAQVHSRQASSSSATSSVANLGSPKPEKRQANSPLPPPPPTGLLSPEVNLEEMYAKVVKKKQRSPESEAITGSVHEPISVFFQPAIDALSHTSAETSSQESLVLRPKQNSMSSLDSKSLQEVRADVSPMMQTIDPKYTDSDYEIVQRLGHNPSDCDPNYEELRPQKKIEDRLDSNQGTSVCDAVGTPDHFDPGYEKVSSDSRDCAEVVNGDDAGEPNYESMSSEGQEPNYAQVSGIRGGSESDPNYEMVQHDDPNYESVNYFEANADPPYERLRNDEVRDSDSDAIPGYEQVRCQNTETMLDCDNIGDVHRLNQSNESGYEVVGRREVGAFSDTWKIGAALSEQQNFPENMDSLYSHIQKNHTKM